MANILTLQTNPQGDVTAALINGNSIGELVTASQTLTRGVLQATLVANFDEVVIEDAPPEAPVAIAATFVGTATNITIKITEPSLTSGNRFAYKFVSPMSAVPTAPSKYDVISDATYIAGTEVVVTEGADGDGYLLYELDGLNRVISYLGHKLTAGEYIG